MHRFSFVLQRRLNTIAFLDQHPFVRGISKYRVASVLLIRSDDDHSSLFPLMIMVYKVNLITSREIFYIVM